MRGRRSRLKAHCACLESRREGRALAPIGRGEESEAGDQDESASLEAADEAERTRVQDVTVIRRPAADGVGAGERTGGRRDRVANHLSEPKMTRRRRGGVARLIGDVLEPPFGHLVADLAHA